MIVPPSRAALSERLGRGLRRLRRVVARRSFGALHLGPRPPTTILFESHRGLTCSCNPRAICEEVLRQKLPVQCVWAVTDLSISTPPGTKKIRRCSPAYYYYHAHARVLVHNAEFADNLPIRKEQVYINTQHGTPLKLMGTDLSYKNPAAYPASYGKTGRWTHLVSPNSYSTDIFRRVHRYDGPVLEVGYPRNDIFFQRNSPTEIGALKEKWGLPPDKKVILYAPTWRDVGASRFDHDFQLALDIDALRSRFGEDYVLLLRLHHLISSRVELTPTQATFAFNVSSAAYDPQELMLCADVLVTDYSSMMFDYAILRRPMIFFTYDLDTYTNETRGTYFDLREEGPGPVVQTMPDLIDALSNIDQWRPHFAQREQAFHEKFCGQETGEAAKIVVDRLIRPAIEDV